MSMTSSNRKPPQKGEAPQEPFKRAVAGCMRAMSGVRELEVTYAAERPSLTGSGESAKAIGTGIDPDDFAERMLNAIDAGEREVMIADHEAEKMIGEARRTPEALIDRMIDMFNSGYAAQMGVTEQ